MIGLGSSASQCLWRRCFTGTFRTTYLSSFSICIQTRSSSQKSDRLNYNSNVFFEDTPSDHAKYNLVTANSLEAHTVPPRCVKMLVRDFIEDSLYNPNYGYFPHQATIFTSSDNLIDFGSLRDSVEFQAEVAKRYAAYGVDIDDGPGRQLWHTPSELFKVHFISLFYYSQNY